MQIDRILFAENFTVQRQTNRRGPVKQLLAKDVRCVMSCLLCDIMYLHMLASAVHT